MNLQELVVSVKYHDDISFQRCERLQQLPPRRKKTNISSRKSQGALDCKTTGFSHFHLSKLSKRNNNQGGVKYKQVSSKLITRVGSRYALQARYSFETNLSEHEYELYVAEKAFAISIGDGRQ